MTVGKLIDRLEKFDSNMSVGIIELREEILEVDGTKANAIVPHFINLDVPVIDDGKVIILADYREGDSDD